MKRTGLRARRWLPWALAAAAACGCQTAPLGPAALGPAAHDPGTVRAAPGDPATDKPADKPKEGDAPKEEQHGLLSSSITIPSKFVPDFLFDPFTVKSPPPPAEAFTLRLEGLVPDKVPAAGSVEADLAGARELFRRGEFAKAEAVFGRIAEDTHNTVPVAEEARYYQAESLRLQQDYPKAADTYMALLNSFPQSPYREQAVQHVFDIANYWLDDTRQEMREWQEYQDGKRWFWAPHFFSTAKTKPFIDREGRAIQLLERVRIYDFNGPLADRALFYCGSIKFYNGDYTGADQYFTELTDKHPNSPLAPKALEYAIMAKHLSTGGALYDARKVAEARRMVQTALDNYPELASAKSEFLKEQLVAIALQQAEKDFQQAEFYRRRGHPGPAYFYYALVVRTYPGTPFADQAAKAMDEMRAKAEKEGGAAAAPAIDPAAKIREARNDTGPTPYSPTGTPR